jgi:hypothetical protein
LTKILRGVAAQFEECLVRFLVTNQRAYRSKHPLKCRHSGKDAGLGTVEKRTSIEVESLLRAA